MPVWIRDIAEVQYPIDNITRQNQELPKLLTSASRWSTGKVPRVSQLDAVTTGSELSNILSSSLARVFAVHPFTSFPYTYQEELRLFLDLVLFRYSTYRMGASVGDRLHNLVMRDELKAQAYHSTHINYLVPRLAPSRALLLLHGVATTIIPYLLRRLLRRSLEEDWGSEENSGSWRYRLTKALRYADIAWSTLSLINMIHFLATGQYRSLVERILGLKMVHGTQEVVRLTNLMILNQQVSSRALAWLLEVLNIGSIVRRVTNSLHAIAVSREAAPENRCCACYELPTIPQRSNCGHLYCYYCIQSRLIRAESDGYFPCLRCGKRMTSCHPDGPLLTASATG